ncbi:unnamed protein product [Rhizoctonia solani]|uniref:Uncharacterized protein n=1 Tax=Rhizoctonia solani TaxID=456999 RepID=A0A8H3GVN4_9AGAM|nr:unnamed protein product [Rhizoctonia solani]
MAPLDSSVYSANYGGRGVPVTPPACVGLLPAEMDSRIEHSINTKRPYEPQYASSNVPCRVLQKNDAASGNRFMQVDPRRVPITSTIKIEPVSDDVPCPLFKSLSRLARSPTTQTPNHGHDAEFGTKTEPDQNMSTEPKPRASDQKDLGQEKPIIADLCNAGSPQVDHVSPGISDPQPRCDARDCSPNENHIKTKISGAGGCLIPCPLDPIPTCGRPTNVVRPSLDRRRILLYFKVAWYPYLIRRRPLGPGNRPPAQAPVPSQLNPQPPAENNNDNDLPDHQDAPQSSRLYKSLYGLAQCLRSEASASSLNSADAPNTPVFNQAGFNNNSPSSSDTSGAANGSANSPEQYSNPDTQEATDDLQVGLELLDSDSLIRIATLCFATLLRRDAQTANEGSSQNYIPHSLTFLSDDPVPLPMQLDEPGARGDFPAAQHPAISETQIQPQPLFSASYSGDEGPDERPFARTSANQSPTGGNDLFLP